MAEHVQELLNDISVLDLFQFSFHPGHRIDMALVILRDDLHNQLGQGVSALLFLLD